MINLVWPEGTVPEGRRYSLVVPIPKADTPSHDISHSRSISLISCTVKIAEQMVNRRLIDFLKARGHLDDR